MECHGRTIGGDYNGVLLAVIDQLGLSEQRVHFNLIGRGDDVRLFDQFVNLFFTEIAHA